MPPALTVCNETSLREEIQAAYPDARVVKTLNTVNHVVMVDPGRVSGEHVIFVCGNEPEWVTLMQARGSADFNIEIRGG